MNARVYIEGGGDSKELHARCREGFRRLLENCGFAGRLPRLVACGGREATFGDFSTAHANAAKGAYIAMLLDSEVPMNDIEQAWAHLKRSDGWNRPDNASDEQALLMTTCMETWVISDREALRGHYGICLQESALPAAYDLEARPRDAIQNALLQATRSCKNRYSKGRRSFEILGRLAPATLKQNLPSFARCLRVLDENL